MPGLLEHGVVDYDRHAPSNTPPVTSQNTVEDLQDGSVGCPALTCYPHASMLITCPKWSKSAMCRTRCTESSRAGLQTQDGRSRISSWPNLNVWPRDRRATRC
jgi:hypothetical protein